MCRWQVWTFCMFVCVWIGNGSHCVCMYCVGLMASFVHRVTELNVRQLSLESVMTLIANCSQNLIWRTIWCHFYWLVIVSTVARRLKWGKWVFMSMPAILHNSIKFSKFSAIPARNFWDGRFPGIHEWEFPVALHQMIYATLTVDATY